MSNSAELPIVAPPSRPRLPQWLRAQPPSGEALTLFNRTRGAVDDGGLHTVCEEAKCPNLHDCWGRGTATFMIAGKECTRGCRFCSVETLRAPAPPEEDEPQHLADAVSRMNLDHVVITVVNRDDQADGGAGHYRKCVEAVHDAAPHVTIELLSSDLAGNWQALADMLDGIPLDVFAHNVECVERLDKTVRDPRASFELSLEMLRRAKELRPDMVTKSSLMVGLGETNAEITESMQRLRSVDVDLITFGQYLAPGRPGERYLAVDRYATPEEFNAWADEALALGFAGVASGPMVRSSFRAGELLADARKKVNR
ncbi:lipoyl synthase [Aeoliella sp. ICT_H6.2]|uniref:Lipoyl synthase n=1 Tax=Aeoliella straminimaris TaxID=2954799 RepID=A0A9X2FAH5_9BACT|nr:lipoyl synthase [Aeoliella straminimaris]MCO6044542.1 lipoyl synthase [Aeoliella straminimaris]